MDEATIKEYLIKHDQEFRKLAEAHRSFERQLRELHEKPDFNDQDQFQEVVLKKKKLAIKDQMQMIISRYHTEHSLQ